MFQNIFGALSASNPGAAVDLQDVSAAAFASGSPSHAIIELRGPGADEGEVWRRVQLNDPLTYHSTALVPESRVSNYQMKWDFSSGDLPTTTTVVAGVWHLLSTGDFLVDWQATLSDQNVTGEVTVSIRRQSGPAADTALWDGNAVFLDL